MIGLVRFCDDLVDQTNQVTGNIAATARMNYPKDQFRLIVSEDGADTVGGSRDLAIPSYNLQEIKKAVAASQLQ